MKDSTCGVSEKENNSETIYQKEREIDEEEAE